MKPLQIAKCRLLICMVLLLCATQARAQQTHLLVITGVPGDEEHAQKFQKWAATFIEAAKQKDAVPEANITLLADKQATKAAIEKAFADLAPRVKPADAVLVLLIGHGSFNGTQAAFNHFGPDLTVDEWAKLLGRLPPQRVAFVDTTSSSGAFLPAVAAPSAFLPMRTSPSRLQPGSEPREHATLNRFSRYFTSLSEIAFRVSVLSSVEYGAPSISPASKHPSA